MRLAWAGLIAAVALVSGAGPPPALGQNAEQVALAIVADYAGRYRAAPNDMAKGALRPERGHQLCLSVALIAARGATHDWVGTVSRLGSTNDGKGTMEIRVSPSFSVATHGITWGDEAYNTLIPANAPLHKKAAALSVGQKVKFSGTFFPSKVDCMEETSLTVAGAMLDPTFLFRFTDISPAE